LSVESSAALNIEKCFVTIVMVRCGTIMAFFLAENINCHTLPTGNIVYRYVKIRAWEQANIRIKTNYRSVGKDFATNYLGAPIRKYRSDGKYWPCTLIWPTKVARDFLLPYGISE
jgi:hypothetical protein